MSEPVAAGTEPAAAVTEPAAAVTERAQTTATRRPRPIVPEQNVAGRALVTVIAIMTFLSCLTLGAVTLVRDTAAVWQSQISREATIQIKPAEGVDMEAALLQAQKVASGFAGVRAVRIVDAEATARLLSPWLGEGIDIEELPVPRLVIVTIDEASPPDFATMRTTLAEQVPGASLDDHQAKQRNTTTAARPPAAAPFAPVSRK